MPIKLPLFVDTDNAMGSPFGDVDDAYALAALWRGGANIRAVGSVFGNTFEPWAFRNNQALAKICGVSTPILRGAQTYWSKGSPFSERLKSLDEAARVLALGPLTNVALALRSEGSWTGHVREVVFTATNYSHRLPATRFFDFNFWKDPAAARAVFASNLPLTCVPCDVARRLRLGAKDLADWPGELGSYFRRHSRRWFLRAILLKASPTVPIWDLVAALYALSSEGFEVIETTASISLSGQVRYGDGGRAIRVVTGFDPDALRLRFRSLVLNG